MSGTRTPRSNREWIYWGQRDPLYGVLSVHGKSKTNASPWTEEEFYAQAIPEFAVNLRHWNSYGLVPEACVEIGCGAGRMTRRLQTVFGTVHACDVASGMVELVRKNCDPAIVQAHLCDGCHLPLPDQSVTAAYSTIVFQHFDSPEAGLAYFREIHRVMKSGATFMINLPWHQFPNTNLQWPYRIATGLARGYDTATQQFKRFLVGLGPSVMNTRVGRRLGEFMGNTSYDFKLLIAELQKIGFQDIEIHSYYVPVEERHHPFFFGRKP
jgi:ubiquinone/menaquinone biosynthesis C-methylase UbiE